MTEAEWLASGDPMGMYWPIKDRLSERKAGLFAVACALSIPLPETPEVLKRAVEVVGRAVEGGDQGEVEGAYKEAEHVCRQAFQDAGHETPPHLLALAALRLTDYRGSEGVCAFHVSLFLGKAVRELLGSEAADRLARLHADLLRDVVGNPFGVNNGLLARPRSRKPARRSRPRPAFEAPWRTGEVVGLARSIYEERSFGHLPILADALEDAGCDNAALLGHCRSAGPHVRGCWVVDRLLDQA
jgi:hypothetical protein